MERTLKHSGDRLRLARSLAGYETLNSFAVASKVAQSTLSHHESGTRGLKIGMAKRYARVLGNVTAGWLLTGEGELPSEAHAASTARIARTTLRRFRAARWAACENVEVAAGNLGMTPEDLQAMERGEIELTQSALVNLSAQTGIPLRWFSGGSWDQLPPVLAARAVFFDPGILPDGPAEEVQTQGRRAGDNRAA